MRLTLLAILSLKLFSLEGILFLAFVLLLAIPSQSLSFSHTLISGIPWGW